ncbi:MAG TPA: hypothetical protein DDW48_08260 [Methyloceanibacter sp.]|jgi:uncharacterized membrane protein|nr:hypothetical protein [Methyloceanibacter sp.]
MSALVSLHLLAAVVWVGGMFFALMVLRPSVGPLPPPERLRLWSGVFSRFFPWVWVSIAVLLGSGYGLIFFFYGGFAGADVHIHLMQVTGLAMTALFIYLYFTPWRRFRDAVASDAFADAAKDLNRIRLIVTVNLVIGLLTVIAGAGGRFW